ncbi:MAG: NAD(P)H-dependent oxidoreductase [Mesorhizobium sp.]
MSKPKIGIIIGSVREGRFAEKVAEWIGAIAKSRSDIDVELVDLKDYPLPFFAEAVSPAWGPSKNEVAQRWQAKLAEFDGFIITAAEYNHAPTAVLKNALDYAGPQWNKKAVAFVGYGGVGGARAIEHLRGIAVELQMASTKAAVHIVWADMLAAMQGTKKLEEFDHLNQVAGDMLNQLVWWSNTLLAARKLEAETASLAA